MPAITSRHFRPIASGAPADLLILACSAFGQQLAPPRLVAATEERKIPNDAIMLTPFEVSSEKDNGFAAASSLAGGRLAGDLRPTPVAFSVITRDFIDALGVTISKVRPSGRPAAR